MELIKDRFYVTRCMDIVRVNSVSSHSAANVVIVKSIYNRAGQIYNVYPDGRYYGSSDVSDKDLLSMATSQEMDAADGEPVTANEIYAYLKSKGVPAGLEVGVVQVKGENPSILTLVFQGRKVTLRPQLRNFWVAISNFIHKEVLQKVEPVERQITRGVYRTRGGNVAIVFGVNGVDELYPAVGVLVSKDSDNAHSPTQWTADGVFIKGSESVNDITTRICDIEEYPITPSKVDSFSDVTDEQKAGEVKAGRYKMRNGCIAVVSGYGYNPEKPIVGHIESSESPKGNILEWTRGGMFRTDGVPCGKDLLKRVERVAVDTAAKTDIPRLYFITRRVDDVKQKTVVVRGGKYITRNGLVATVERVSLEDSTNYPLFGQTVGALGVAFGSQWDEHGKSNVHEKFDLVAHMDDLPDAIIELAVRGFTRGARNGCVR